MTSYNRTVVLQKLLGYIVCATVVHKLILVTHSVLLYICSLTTSRTKLQINLFMTKSNKWKYLRCINTVTMKLTYFSQSRNGIIICHQVFRLHGIRMLNHNVQPRKSLWIKPLESVTYNKHTEIFQLFKICRQNYRQ